MRSAGLAEAGKIPAGARCQPRRGRAAARSLPWRSRHQRRHGAGQGSAHEPARPGRAARRRSAGRPARHQGRDRRARLHQSSGCKPAVLHEVLRAAVVDTDGFGRSGQGAGAAGERGISSPPIPTGPMHVGHGRGAVFGDALVRTARISPATRSPASTTSTMPARRSTFSPARPILRYREALGQDIGAIPEGLYPGDYLKPVGERLAQGTWPGPAGQARSRMAAARAARPPSTP